MNTKQVILDHFEGLRAGHRKPEALIGTLAGKAGMSPKEVLKILKDLSSEGVHNVRGNLWAWRAPDAKLPASDELRELRKRVAELSVRQVSDARYEKFIGEISERRPKAPPTWLAGSAKHHDRIAVPTAMLSDTHFDEVVDTRQINHANAYNRQIAGERLEMFFRHAVKIPKIYMNGLSYPGFILPLGGDNFSGDIHEELAKTNAGSTAASIVYWLSPMVAGIKMLAEEFGQVYIPCVVGNHGRVTKKPIHKGRVQDNYDWLFYQLLAREFWEDKRVHFDISDAPDMNYRVFQTEFCLTHGDQFKGGSGISGLLSPLMLGDHRKRKRNAAINMAYDILLMGHFHTLMLARGVAANGSLVGYNEFASNLNLEYQPPQQMFFMTSRERRGIWAWTPINVTASDDPYSGTRFVDRSDVPVVFK